MAKGSVCINPPSRPPVNKGRSARHNGAQLNLPGSVAVGRGQRSQSQKGRDRGKAKDARMRGWGEKVLIGRSNELGIIQSLLGLIGRDRPTRAAWRGSRPPRPGRP
jgi:hypothetical protein